MSETAPHEETQQTTGTLGTPPFAPASISSIFGSDLPGVEGSYEPGELTPSAERVRGGATSESGVRPSVQPIDRRRLKLMNSTRITRHVRARRAAVYRALVDPRAIEMWRVPFGMTSVVHEFDAREGGAFRISLSYNDPTAAGKTAAHTDTYHGHFGKLVPNEQVVEVFEFETADPQLRGEMTLTTTLSEVVAGTEVAVVHQGIPPGVSAADNETGTRMALDRLAALVEST
jgi:uncharacterized protein YndB with AHSA1/START domain